MRLSESCYRLAISAAPGPAYSKLTRQAYHRKRGVLKRFILNDCPLSVVMLKNPKNDPDEPLLYFISSLTHNVKIMEAYRRRWRIETYFKHLKTQGFNRTGGPD
ncbi:transposase [Spirosoma jeollabukense]